MTGGAVATATALAGNAPLRSLPPLRQDLRLHESGADKDGAPFWVIQDPLRNRFYRIGWLEYECLLRWPGDPASIAADIAAKTPLAADAGQVEAFARFLEQHHLLALSENGRQRLLGQLRQPGWRHWRWWLHHYLFIRVPLLRPERFLARLAPLVQPLFSPTARLILAAIIVTGLILVAQQWDSFTHGVTNILTPEGILGFLLALTVSKTFHELGHALVATRLGVRVAHMGVALLVLWPVLYTDTGESWRLRSHRQRLAISVAGIGVELTLAGLATVAWALLDDGALRQAALYLATTGWVLSLALNASPFMRFDGYFILSDLLDFPNLHERAGAQARVWLRRHLLGFADPWPEHFTPRKRRALVAFALVTWLYRLVLFLGIAWAVYHYFFKALGIFLMGVEIGWFVLRPIWSEISIWRARGAEILPDRRRLWLILLMMGGIVLLVPWRFGVSGKGVAHVEQQQLVFSPFPAQLEEIHPPGPVAAGAVLARLNSPDVAARETQAQAAASAMERRLTGLLDTEDGTEQQMVLTGQLTEQHAEIRAARDEMGRLLIVAAFAGEWRDVAPDLRPGMWLSVREPLGILIDPRQWVVDAYVEQRLVDRVQPGATAEFIAEGSPLALPGVVLAIDSTRSQRLLHPMLDSRHGGALATDKEKAEPIPSDALYRVRLRLDRPPPTQQQHELRGTVHIRGAARSLAWEAVKGTLAAVIRESGF